MFIKYFLLYLKTGTITFKEITFQTLEFYIGRGLSESGYG
jgi:hypothetical protein